MKTTLGYPDHEATVRVLRDAKTRDRTKALEPVVTSQVILDMAELADEVHVDDAILDYVSRLAEETRRHVSVRLGLSVRGCLAFIRCAKTWAISQGRTHVIPDDIKLLAGPVLNHRLLVTAEAQFAGITVEQVIDQVLGEVAPPTERVA
jgi:MoxR-like ATPase